MRGRPLRPVFLSLLVPLAALAGCVTAGPDAPGDVASTLSEPVFGILDEALPMEMDDGVTLEGWVFRPDAEGRFPIILQTSPYFSNSDPPVSEGGQKFSLWLVDYFVPRGYAVVLQSVRGTGDSEGCFGMGGPREMQDHYDVVEALAAMPWSNGKVGMIGKSYRGTTPHMAAVLDPPHLTTIVPIAGITDWYWYTQYYGTTYSAWADFNARYYAAVGFNQNPLNPSPEKVHSVVPLLPGRFCEDAARLIAETGTNLAAGDYTEFYEERNYAKDVDRMTASVYLIHGLQDWNVKPDQFGDWFNRVSSPKKAVLGQMDHEYPLRGDWGQELHRWFDHWLKGIDTGIMDEPAVEVEDNLGRWRREDTWPPARVETVAYKLGVGGELTTGDAPEGTLTYVGAPDPESPEPMREKDTELVFTSESLSADFHTAGMPDITFTAAVSAANTQLNAILYDVEGDEWTPVNCAALDARHRESLESAAPLTPGAPTEFTLRFHPQDHVFRAGNRIGLVLTGSNPDWIQAEGQAETVAVTVGPTAQLRLPALPGELRLEAPQPEMVPAHELPWTSAESPSDFKLPPCLIGLGFS